MVIVCTTFHIWFRAGETLVFATRKLSNVSLQMSFLGQTLVFATIRKQSMMQLESSANIYIHEVSRGDVCFQNHNLRPI